MVTDAGVWVLDLPLGDVLPFVISCCVLVIIIWFIFYVIITLIYSLFVWVLLLLDWLWLFVCEFDGYEVGVVDVDWACDGFDALLVIVMVICCLFPVDLVVCCWVGFL